MLQVTQVKLNPRVPGQNRAFRERKVLFVTKLDSNLTKKPVKCYIWSITLHDAETWAHRKADHK